VERMSSAHSATDVTQKQRKELRDLSRALD
jgi:hypothetical protein